jgi:hypothetical protein
MHAIYTSRSQYEREVVEIANELRKVTLAAIERDGIVGEQIATALCLVLGSMINADETICPDKRYKLEQEGFLAVRDACEKVTAAAAAQSQLLLRPRTKQGSSYTR